MDPPYGLGEQNADVHRLELAGGGAALGRHGVGEDNLVNLRILKQPDIAGRRQNAVRRHDKHLISTRLLQHLGSVHEALHLVHDVVNNDGSLARHLPHHVDRRLEILWSEGLE